MKRIVFLLIAVAAMLSFGSCAKRISWKEYEDAKKEAYEKAFDYKTRESMDLNLDYGNLGAGALIEVYENCPLVPNHVKGCNEKTSESPLFSYFADANGRINASYDLPIHVSDGVYLYSDAACVPQCTYAEINNKSINYKNERKAIMRSTTKVAANPVARPIEGHDGYFYVVEPGDGYGQPNDFNEIMSEGTLSTTEINAVASDIKKWTKAEKEKYTKDLQIHTVVSSVITKNGQRVPVDKAEIFVEFLTEDGWNQSVFGYYFYPTPKDFDNGPATPDGINKYVLIPNASVKDNGPFGTTGYNNGKEAQFAADKAPMEKSRKFQLLYVDENGNATKFFPPNTTVGYFFIAGGWVEKQGTKAPQTKASTSVAMEIGDTKELSVSAYSSWSTSNNKVVTLSATSGTNVTINAIGTGSATITATSGSNWSKKTTTWNVTVTTPYIGSIDFTKPTFYTDTKWNTDKTTKRFACHDYVNTDKLDRKIYGIEDGTDADFNDLIFVISGTPDGVLLVEDDPRKPVEFDENVYARDTTFNTYCFEDLWPSRGDYDMNDVAVEHQSIVEFNQDNEVLKVVDNFTVCNPEGSAAMVDAFAVVIPMDQRGKMTLSEGVQKEDATNSIILFEDSQTVVGQTFTITREFDATNTLSRQYLKVGLDMNPYIIPVSSTTRYGLPKPADSNYTEHWSEHPRYEVHMPKSQPTIYCYELESLMTPEALEDHTFRYWVDGKHPFAICLPLSVTKGEYALPNEYVSIDIAYPKFTNWVESNNNEDRDWYLYPAAKYINN